MKKMIKRLLVWWETCRTGTYGDYMDYPPELFEIIAKYMQNEKHD